MQKAFPQLARKLRLRIAALEEAQSFEDLREFDPLGKWHPLSGDRSGQWSGRLSANWRIIVIPLGGSDELECVVALVHEITDYH